MRQKLVVFVFHAANRLRMELQSVAGALRCKVRHRDAADTLKARLEAAGADLARGRLITVSDGLPTRRRLRGMRRRSALLPSPAG